MNSNCHNGIPAIAIYLFLLAWLAPISKAAGELTVCSETNFLAALKEGGLIKLNCDGVLTFTNTLDIVAFTKIDASGHAMTISGGGQARIFNVKSNVQLSLIHLTVNNGSLTGASGTNGTPGQFVSGAAVFNGGGAVFADGCAFSGHSLVGGAGGDGIFTNVFAGRSHPAGGAGGSAAGGAIYNAGSLTLTNCTFSGNVLTAGKGGNGATGASVGNGGDGGDGGAGGQGQGAAIYNAPVGTVFVSSCSFFTNNIVGGNAGAGGAGTGVLGFPGNDGPPGTASGAAIFNAGGSVQVINSTFAGNLSTAGDGMPGSDGILDENGIAGESGGHAAGGAIFNSGSLTITNCTLFGNLLVGGNGGKGGNGGPVGFGGDGAKGGAGGLAEGGGIFNGGTGTTLCVNCTFAQNSVRGGAAGAGGKAGGALGRKGAAGDAGWMTGAAVFSENVQLGVKNSILADSLLGNNVGGVVTDLGFNLNSDRSLNVIAMGSSNNVNAMLGPLTNNGGLTPTMAIATNSPAVNAITVENGCPPVDQRGAFRTNARDIGAFELNGLFRGPALNLGRGTNTVLLAWPSSATDFGIETATNVNVRTWTLVPSPPQVTNSQNLLSFPLATNQNRFFRLRRQ